MSAAAELGRIVAEARHARRTVDAETAPDDVSLAQAYEIQAEQFGGRELAGYKLGLVSPAKQRQMGLAHPVFGRVAAEMLLDGPVDLGAFVQPRAEPELAVVLRAAIAPGATAGAARTAVGAAFLAVDILDSIWADYRFGLSQVVADNTSGGGFLLGERVVELGDEGELRLLLDGEPLTRGPLEALGGTLEHLAWLAAEVGGLAAGAVVFVGSPAAAVPIHRGFLELHGPGGAVLTANLEAG